MPATINGKPIDEVAFSKAKSIAEKEGKEGNFAFIVGVYKRLKGIKESINVIEDVPLKWGCELDVKESKDENGEKILNIGGVALKEGLSSNNNDFQLSEFSKNDGNKIKYFSEHRIVEEHLVGVGVLDLNKGILRHSGIIRNTKSHPDIVENSAKGWLGVSIDGHAKRIERIGEGENATFKPYGVHISNIAITATPSVDGAGIDFAISESFDNQDKGFRLNENEESQNNNKGEENMENEEKLKLEESKVKILETEKSLEKSNKELEDMKTKLKESEDAMNELKINSIVERIKKVNPKIEESVWKDKSESELKLIETYETKLSESEHDSDDEVEDDEEDEDKKDDKDDKSKKDLKASLLEDNTGISIKESAKNKLDDELKKLYG